MVKDAQNTTILLLALAVGDLLTLWSQVPQYMGIVTPEIFNATYTFDYVNDYVQGAYVWLQVAAPEFADWILIAFSIGRVRAVIAPLSHQGASPARTSRVVIVCAFLYAAATSLYTAVTQYYLLATLDIPTFDIETGRPVIRNLPYWLDTWNTANALYKDVEVIVVFVIFLTCNIIIIRAIVQRRRTTSLRKTSTSTDRKQTSGKAILISAVSTYLVCMLPQTINEILEMLARYPYCVREYRMYATVWRPAELLMLIPYSFNFYLYVAFSMKFRKEARSTFRRILARFPCRRGRVADGCASGQRKGSETYSVVFQVDSRRASDALVVKLSTSNPRKAQKSPME
ncbi:probable G-protein coupled receptor 142 [Paramacrobiotus metropolitanus]|uniref:probable G-protein coupled receptor 142 n=1 Tax=Paramacrobiotus metropolitanus TaxID=2943436 RepID=UPI002445AF73|nr:probable G-protein coupled receptor 142 [Paramacrobiotus metropolitanus]